MQDTLHYVEKAAEQLLLLSDLRLECDNALADRKIEFYATCLPRPSSCGLIDARSPTPSGMSLVVLLQATVRYFHTP